MKKILFILIMTLFLTGCSAVSEPQIQYIEKEVRIEVPVEVEVEKIVEVEVQCEHLDVEDIYWNNLCIKKCKSCGHNIITQAIILDVTGGEWIYTKQEKYERWDFRFNCKVLQCVGKFSFPATLINGNVSLTFVGSACENESLLLTFRFHTKPCVGDKLSIEGYDTCGNTIEWFYILTDEDVNSL